MKRFLFRKVWSRLVPLFAISLYKEYRGQGIGSQLMLKMLELLKGQGYKKTKSEHLDDIL